jgi:hypothetical protein
MFDKKQPLWLPQGSVRALLAGLVVAAAVTQAPPDAIVRFGEIVLVAYFVGKAAGAAATPRA